MMNQDMTIRFKLPTQTYLAGLINIEKSTAREVWSILTGRYRIVVTKKGIGTFRVSELSVLQKKKNEVFIQQVTKSESRTVLDYPMLASLSTDLDKKIRYAERLCRKLSGAELALMELNDLVLEFTKFCSAIMNYTYVKEEICYSASYLNLITYVFGVWCKPEKIVAVMTPIPADVKRAFRTANRYTYQFYVFNPVDLIVEFETICRFTNVGLAYFGPTLPYSILSKLDAKFWKKLYELQHIYGFKIMIDNPSPGFVQLPNLLQKMEAGSNDALIILIKSSAHISLKEINIIAGPEPGISILKKRLPKDQPLASPWVSYQLLHLLSKGNLQKHEQRACRLFNEMMQSVKMHIITKDIFNEDYILKSEGWYIHLELKVGSFPKNIHSILYRINYFVVHPLKYASVPGLGNGILISVGFYPAKNQLLKNIDKLIVELIPWINFHP